MKPYRIRFGSRSAPRLELTVYATDSAAALEAHLCLAEPSERVEVLAL